MGPSCRGFPALQKLGGPNEAWEQKVTRPWRGDTMKLSVEAGRQGTRVLHPFSKMLNKPLVF